MSRGRGRKRGEVRGFLRGARPGRRGPVGRGSRATGVGVVGTGRGGAIVGGVAKLWAWPEPRLGPSSDCTDRGGGSRWGHRGHLRPRVLQAPRLLSCPLLPCPPWEGGPRDDKSPRENAWNRTKTPRSNHT